MNNPIIPFYKQVNEFIVKAKDCYLYDARGKQYLDFESGDWAANLGHSRDEICCVIKKQVDELVHDGLRFRNKESEELSVRLLEKLSLKNGKSVFVNSGSEAVNLGITLAKNLTGRKKILKMDCSFLSSYGHGQITPNNDFLVNIPMNRSDLLSQIDLAEIAAFVFEPGNAWGLIKFPVPEFIDAVTFAVKRAGGLLMANEVTTGFGRTGKWFGHQYYNYSPDIVSTGKALGNGYPVSCVSVNEEVAELFEQNHFRYAQSHQNDPLGCAVGIEVIKVFEKTGLVQQSFEKGNYFTEKLEDIQKKHSEKFKEVRARGLMIALELDTRVRSENIYSQLLDDGIIVGVKENVLRFMPPLTISKSQIDKLINALDRNLGIIK